MSVLRFTVTFHGPFRVGTGTARHGAHQTAWRQQADESTLVAPASTVKGVMRAAASDVLPESLVGEVFGSPGRQSPWAWSPLTVPSQAVRDRLRTRIRISGDTGTVAEDMLAVAEELKIDQPGEFTVRRLGFVPLQDPAEQQRHRAVLVVAAGLVKGMGGTRRRGLGWVSLRPEGADARTAFEAAVEALPELTGGTA